ncbi:helix-turn-helix domain-containing protein [Methanoculleus sp.]|jgi:DNA-binding HxlR family transcriptional regulator|uniref:winged helix-turn-helix transcriptional regulator n=1 Tax=Methanoculleus sp. TaxID=90427 RepID=UPI0025E7AB48|nr:helix-turn-helix domain-containing protein [Methanoculleus sp.]HOI59596.1 helix-turn-helix domain-containing protein [Methanoculleus sp.]
MCNDSKAFATCPLRGILPVIAKKWTLLIITTIGRAGTIRFTELQGALPGISPKTLTDTLKVLVDEHLVERHCYAEIPPRVEYSLTGDGAGLREAILPLLQWASERDAGQATACALVTPSGACTRPAFTP